MTLSRTLFAIILILLLPVVHVELHGQNANDSVLLPTTPTPRFTFGGELRSRVRTFRGINFGDVYAPQHDYDTYLNLRGILFTDVHISKSFRIYAQLTSANTYFKDAITAADRDFLAAGQMFLDVQPGKIPLRFRLGRQQLAYGSGRVLGSSDGPNVAQNFDGFEISADLNKFTGKLMIARPVKCENGVFDNYMNKNNLFYGSFWTLNLKDNPVLDLYFFGNHLKDVEVDTITANESRYTLGARISKSTGSFIYETEATWQFGNHDVRKISAFYFSSMAGYTWKNSHLEPSLRIRGTLYSGDKDSTDRRLQYFRPIYSRPPVNNMAPFGPTNIIMFAPEGSILVTKKASVTLRYYMVWRYSHNDGLYSSRMDQMTREPDEGGIKKGFFVTDGLNIQLDYTFNKYFNVSISSGYFVAGRYIQNTGVGKNVWALFFTSWFRF
jgi:hypothetical protein